MPDNTSQSFKGPIAYLTGEYPRATDTFIQREVMALRERGITVFTNSIRKTDALHLVGEEQKAEAKNTFYVLKAARSPFRLVYGHFNALIQSPGRYFRGLRLALATGSPGWKSTLYQVFYFAEAVILANHLNKLGVRHLHNHIATASCSVAMLASEISGIPYSFTLHGPDIFFEPIRWRLDAKIARASFVACISNYCRSQAMIHSKRSDWSKLHIVHCGVDPARYSKIGERTGKRVLFVGRLAAVKGLPVLFEALTKVLPHIPDLKVTLIGDGPERLGLEREARNMGVADSIEFAGYCSQSEVAEMLRHTDLLVLPSFAEGLPVVLMEALAARVPVVATQIAGVSELVEDGINGAMVPPGDAERLAEKILELLNDDPLRAKMGDLGCEKVALDFDITIEAGRLAALFEAYGSGEGQLPIRPDAQKVAR